ncbi:MAG: FliI/YscN family ATPase [Candidatus Latescibacteria bacterium]|nr:FliI/YscN family ATPase [bacterium]MBD3424477.1 FliI/YscN family ATPase [Candidatus Latescibacterota bacterium]
MIDPIRDKLAEIRGSVAGVPVIRKTGQVTGKIGMVLEVEGLECSVGDLCLVERGYSAEPVRAEVTGFRDEKLLLMPFDSIEGISEGMDVYPGGEALKIPPGETLLGRVIDGTGRPQDGLGEIETDESIPVNNLAPLPLHRQPINMPLETGVKVVDSILTIGRGQRMGVFSGSGLGKSVLLGMMCRNASSDVNVIALIGERGREVREFVENTLGPEGLRKSVVISATSDRSAVERVKGVEVAMSVAEYFRERGKDVLLVLDSLTRFAMAQREIGLAAGEPPTARGYTPSVFSSLATMLERAGNGKRGSITGIYSVLVEGDDVSADPLTDAIRAILDGHIILSRRMANSACYPAIDILASISRLAPQLLDDRQQKRREKVLQWYGTYRESEDLINIGAYKEGTNPDVDEAIEKYGSLRDFFRQSIGSCYRMNDTEEQLSQIVGI